MESTALVVGVVVMILGVGLVFGAVLRSFGSSWSVNRYEVGVLVGVGFLLLFLGRWLIT